MNHKYGLRIGGVFIFAVAAFFVWWFWSSEGTDRKQVSAAAGQLKTSPSKAAITTALYESASLQERGSAPGRRTASTSSPKFQLTKEEIENVRSEMKISLSALYGAEKSFYFEFHRYSTDLATIGYGPEDGQWHKVGFIEPFYPEKLTQTEDPRVHDTSELKQFAQNQPLFFRQNAEKISLADFRRFCKKGCTASESHFELLAATQLIDGYPAEVWLIDDQKNLIQVQDGTLPAEK